MTDIFVQGLEGKTSLSWADRLVEGNESEIFVSGEIAYKIYRDPRKVIPLGKIKELGVLQSNEIIKPINIILDTKNTPIGYTMRFLKNAVDLSQTFTRTYRDKVGITPKMVANKVKSLRDTVEYIHQKGILIVNLNELDVVTDKDYRTLSLIDVGSYCTPNYHPGMIMESVRDRHAKKFDMTTDWFAFAILTFQMFIGIHPFKGKHAAIHSLDERMKKNISILNNSVTFPKICYPFCVIPQVYMQWYKSVFEKGERLPPPRDLIDIVNLYDKTIFITDSHNFDIVGLFIFDSNIVNVISRDGIQVVSTVNSVYKNNRKLSKSEQENTHVAITEKSQSVIKASYYGGDWGKDTPNIYLYNFIDSKMIEFEYNVQQLVSHNGSLYCKIKDTVNEICFSEDSFNKCSLKRVAKIHEKNAKLFDGVIIHHLLSRNYCTIITSDGTIEYCITELIGRIMDAKYDNNVLMVVCCNNGIYDRFVIKFSTDKKEYKAEIVKDIAYCGLNFVTLDNGICCHISENEEFCIFSNVMGDDSKKIIRDNNIRGDCKLFKDGTMVLIAQGNVLSSISLKKFKITN